MTTLINTTVFHPAFGISEDLLLQLRSDILENGSVYKVIDINTGETWQNIGGFNGNSFDLWLIKKGTKGRTNKTFVRLYLKRYIDIFNELVSRNLPVSDKLLELVNKENEIAANKVKESLAIISSFTDSDKVREWLINDDGLNSARRRNRWYNRCSKRNIAKEQWKEFRDHCFTLLSE